MHPLTGLSRIAIFAALAAAPAWAQQTRTSVSMKGHVSRFVAVSARPAPAASKGVARVSASNVGSQTLVLSLSGLSGGETEVDIPVHVRSNTDFTLTASCMTEAVLTRLSVVGVDGAGRLVYPGAAERVEVAPALDARRGAPPVGGWYSRAPVTVLHGPPVSTGGTLESPGNMIEVVLRVALKAPSVLRGQAAMLKVSAAPRPKGQ